jgi:hypothetical protein
MIWHSGQRKLRKQVEASRQQTEQLAQLSAENERLSNQVARAKGPQSLSQDQLRELLRLRGQIGLMREVGKEMVQLQATNEQLRAVLAKSVDPLAEARAAPNFWVREQLTFAGYAEPEAALKTLLWAMNNGDIKSFLACWTSGSEVSARVGRELGEKTDAEMAAEGETLAENLDPSIGFHILDKKVKSADQVILDLSFDGEGNARKFVMQRTGNEWKVGVVLSPGEAEP